MTPVLALSAWTATFGLVLIFFVVFPVLVHGLLVFIGIATAGEHAENREFLERGPERPHQR
jgi:hypothetical protein